MPDDGADRQGRGGARVRGRGAARSTGLSTRRQRRRERGRARGPDADPRLRRPDRARRPGDGRARDRRAGAGDEAGRRRDRRRRRWRRGSRSRSRTGCLGCASSACSRSLCALPGVAGRQAPVGARSASTICDGIAVKRPGELTRPLVAEFVDEVVTVSDDEVAEAMVLLLERSKLVVEGAGAASVAALLAGKVEVPREGEVCAMLSGGNVDAARLVECIRLGETAAGRRLVFSTVVPDRPGALARLVGSGRREGRERARRRPHPRGRGPARSRDGDPARAADRRPRARRADPRRGPGARASASPERG